MGQALVCHFVGQDWKPEKRSCPPYHRVRLTRSSHFPGSQRPAWKMVPSFLLASSQLFGLAKRDKLATIFIPKDEVNAAKTFHDGDAADIAELRIVFQHFRKPVTGNPRGQMMHVMNADIARHPAQHARQHVMRRTMQRGLCKLPLGTGRPMRFLELMLHVEQPDAGSAGQR